MKSVAYFLPYWRTMKENKNIDSSTDRINAHNRSNTKIVKISHKVRYFNLKGFGDSKPWAEKLSNCLLVNSLG